MQSNLNNLIGRARNVTNIGACMNTEDISKVASMLNVIFPHDFIQINTLFRYDLLYNGDLLDFTADQCDWSGVKIQLN